MEDAARINHGNQLNPYHNEFWNCRGLEKPTHDEIPAKTNALWKEDSDPAGTLNRANQLNPYHNEFWNCRGFKKPYHDDIPAGQDALINYYKDRKTYGGEMDLDNYWPLEAIIEDNRSNSSDDEGTDLDDEVNPNNNAIFKSSDLEPKSFQMSRYMYQNSSRDVEQKTDENDGAGLGVLLGVGAVAGLAALGLEIFKNYRENTEEQRRRRAYQ